MDKRTFNKLTIEQKKVLLNALGYKVEEDGLILDENGKPHECPYTKKNVFLENASIMPGSVIVMNTSSITLSEYMSDYVDDE